ncbi:hypothetical protein ES703_53046 [subsurface metagenome]
MGANADQKKLGDESDGSRAHPTHLVPLFYENEDGEKGEKITPDDELLLPFSTRWTCGECHSYGIIGKGLHFNAADPNVAPARPGQPWILADARTGTQIPLSYRRWPGTFKPEQVGLTAREFTKYFGRHTPGGGAGELETEDPDEIMRQFISGKLEINCLSCHNAHPGQNQGGIGGYAVQIARENFRWAVAGACEFASVSGSTEDMLDTYDPFMPEPPEDPKKVPPTVTYRKDAFDHNNEVLFDIVRQVPAHRCYFCHSNLYLDEKDAEKWSSDEDVHLTAGLTCIDCHRNGIDHNITRGYEAEASVSTNPLSATTSCEGCHLGERDSSSPVAGRLGAPVPEHPGIPPVHFEKLTCTACHAGPWPSQKTHLTKTSRAHRLGTLNVNKSHEVLPHIIAPVFAKQPNGKITPHKLLWPAFWGSLEDEKVTPIDFEIVRQTIGEVFAGVELPASGDWPDLTVEEHIVKALMELQKVVKGQPVYICGGKLYRLDIRRRAKLVSTEHYAAQPYLWPIAHDVRPAAQSLGVRYCTDCHATDAPFFFGDVTVDSPIVAAREAKKMIEFQGISPSYAWAFAFSFVFRPFMKFICLGSCAVLAIVLLLYALKLLACIAKALTERD